MIHSLARTRRAGLTAAIAVALVPAASLAQAPVTADILLEVNRYEVEGDNPISAGETEEALRPHLGRHRDVSSLEAAAEGLEKRIRDRGFAFHRVIVPAQKPSGGVVKLQILRFSLERVEVTGNQNFSAENIKRSVPSLAPGTSPDVLQVSRELALANEHPSKRLSVVMKESAQRDALDAEIRVRDVPAQQTFMSLTGHSGDRYDEINRNTGYTRLTIGHQRTNLFDRDHALTLAYTTSPDHVRDVTQLGAFYWIPFYGYHTSLQLYYTRSDVDSGTIGAATASFNVSGRGEFFGGRLSYSLPKYGDAVHSVSAAIDDKHFESTQSVNVGGGFSATPIPDIHSRPLSLRYLARVDQPWGSFGGHLEYSMNLRGGSASDAAAYEATRPGAPRDWDAYHYGLDASYALQGWGLSLRLRGQHAHSPLIPGEQFGLGGIGSIRGLRDRELTGDRGYTLTLEALGPAVVDTLQPLVFVDQGRVALVQPPVVAPGVITSGDSAASLGVGLRWNWQRALDVSADLAYVANGLADNGTTPGTPSGRSKLHFSLFYRF